MAPLETVDNLGKIVIGESKDKGSWIVKSAEELSKKFKDEALKKAKDNSERIIEQGKYIGTKERQKIMSTAEMEAKKLLLNAKEALIDEALKKAKEEYEKLRGKKEYQDILVKQVISSIMELDGKEFMVEVHEGDGLEFTDKIVSTIERETKKKGLKLVLKEVSKDLGGVIVHEKGGKISVDNTFDSILERKKSEIRLKISGILFE